MKYLLTIVGATAIGKTRLAIELAQYFKTEIISADSRQFYKEMQIGTAVPSKEELQKAQHHFIQHKSIFDTYSVGDFERDAIEKMQELFQVYEILIMVGGSGLYVDAICNGLDYFPDVSPEIRKKLITEYQQKGIFFLQEKLQQLDPKCFNQIDRNNPQRMIRALEVSISSGKPYSSFLNQKHIERPFQIIPIALTADRTIIYERINQRVNVMLAQGLLQEAQKLYPYKNYNALQTVGYRELFDFFNRKSTLTKAIENIKTNTRRFAKRQLTWFQKNKKIQWFDYQTDVETIIRYVETKN